MQETHYRLYSKAPEISAPPVRLTPFSSKHLTGRYVSWLNDEEVVRFSEQRHRIHTLDSCTQYADSFLTGPSMLWAIATDAGSHIGNVSATVDPKNRLADIGILIGEPGMRGSGIGFAVWNTVLAFLLTQPKIEKVTGGCLSTNVAMRRIMEKSGMVQDGFRYRHYRWEGQRVNLEYWAVFNDHQDIQGTSGQGSEHAI